MTKLVKCDVLVIGSGAAGLRAAIEAHDNGASVVVVGKCKRGDAHTILATGGINAALGTMDPEDRWSVHSADTLKEGWMLADYRNVELLCKNAPAAIQDLVNYGVKFHREEDGRLTQRFFGAHTYRRTCFVGDETGKAILLALVKEAKKRKFPFYADTYVVSLTKSGEAVNGAIALDMKTKEDIVFNSKCVVLATGGYSRLYRVSSSREMENTGDGILLGYEAGAELMDMEMVQFHPTGMVWPRKMWGTLVTEAVRGEGGRLYNTKNERFMERYDKQRMELGPRDEVARSIYNEIKEGRGTKHGGVWEDISFRPLPYIKKRLPKMYRQFKAVGVDISKKRMEVAPTAHYSMGGLRVNFATGERRFRSVEGTGFLLDGLLLTCWHCTRAPLQDEMMYGFCQGVRIISLRHMGVPIETFTRIDEMDLVVTRVPFSNSLRFRLSKAGPQTGDEVWTFGYPLSDRADTPEGGFTLHPRVFKGHVLRTFTYEHHQFGPTPSLELSFPVPPGLSGAPIVRANSLKIVGMAYGNNDVQLVEELSTTDPETGSRKPEVSRIIPFGLAHPLHILQRAVSVGYSLPVDEE